MLRRAGRKKLSAAVSPPRSDVQRLKTTEETFVFCVGFFFFPLFSSKTSLAGQSALLRCAARPEQAGEKQNRNSRQLVCSAVVQRLKMALFYRTIECINYWTKSRYLFFYLFETMRLKQQCHFSVGHQGALSQKMQNRDSRKAHKRKVTGNFVLVLPVDTSNSFPSSGWFWLRNHWLDL